MKADATVASANAAPHASAPSSAEIAALHAPVMCAEILTLLAPALESANEPVVIDATLGLGGHSEAILRHFPAARVVGIDRDSQALELAEKRLAPFRERLQTVHATYDQIGEVARDLSRTGRVDAVLMDLGVSSLQLDDDERGFSYARRTDLDMRMDQSQGPDAAHILAHADLDEITRILRLYGEERYARRIARAIVERRTDGALRTSEDLAQIVKEAIPAPARRTGGNPAKRTFQALRIAVNDELAILTRAIPAALGALRVGGRMVVESYQSLEDRIVKRYFAAGARDDTPPELPVRADQVSAPLRLITHGAMRATEEEITQNPRAKSVRLRAVEVRTHYQPPTLALGDNRFDTSPRKGSGR